MNHENERKQEESTIKRDSLLLSMNTLVCNSFLWMNEHSKYVLDNKKLTDEQHVKMVNVAINSINETKLTENVLCVCHGYVMDQEKRIQNCAKKNETKKNDGKNDELVFLASRIVAKSTIQCYRTMLNNDAHELTHDSDLGHKRFERNRMRWYMRVEKEYVNDTYSRIGKAIDAKTMDR